MKLFYARWMHSKVRFLRDARQMLRPACVCATLSYGPDSLTSFALSSCNHTAAATVCTPSSRYGLLCGFRSPAVLRHRSCGFCCCCLVCCAQRSDHTRVRSTTDFLYLAAVDKAAEGKAASWLRCC